MNYWLMKSEPDCFSIDDLQRRPRQTEHWDGVRNYQARNMLRDDMRVGDLAFFYHSTCAVPGVVGVVTIVRAGYPDFTASDPTSDHYDPKHNTENPRWYMVDVQFKQKFDRILTLSELKNNPALTGLRLIQKGSRLSIIPVSKEHWRVMMDLV